MPDQVRHDGMTLRRHTPDRGPGQAPESSVIVTARQYTLDRGPGQALESSVMVGLRCSSLITHHCLLLPLPLIPSFTPCSNSNPTTTRGEVGEGRLFDIPGNTACGLWQVVKGERRE